jgi:serine/threonine protein kinase
MSDPKTDFAKNLYIDIACGDTKPQLVRNRVSGQILVKKVLDIYSIPVFTYLKKHPDMHLSTVVDFWEDNGRLVVIEELINGNTLAYLLENHLLSEAEKMDYIKQICDGVNALHHAVPQIIHRDLKASNVMVTNDHIVKVIDYDAAKIYQPHETRDTVLIGTEGNAAPEQYGFMASDERTDIYALGILIKEMFPTNAYMMGIGRKASSFAPEQRYASVTELKNEIDHRNWLHSLIFNIPGLRSSHLATRIFAAIGYILLFTGVFNSKPFDTAANRAGIILCCFMVLSWIDLFGHWTGMFDRFPLLNRPEKGFRILGYCLAATAIFLFWAFILGMTVSSLK